MKWINVVIVEDMVVVGYLDDMIGFVFVVLDEEQVVVVIGICKGNMELLNVVNGMFE